MIVRVWRGQTTSALAESYQTFVTTVVFPKVATVLGYLGGRVLRRPLPDDDAVEFLVMTRVGIAGGHSGVCS